MLIGQITSSNHWGPTAIANPVILQHGYQVALLYIHGCGPVCEATRAKEVFTKHVESVLSKSAKIRALVTDLQKIFSEDPTARKFLVIYIEKKH